MERGETVVHLRGLEFWAFHGCFPEEAVVGNRFTVELEMGLDTRRAQRSDDLMDTLNYQLAYGVIAREMGQNSHLLEHLTRRIVDALMAAFAQLRWVEVEVSKHNPPIGGQLGSVSVRLREERDTLQG